MPALDAAAAFTCSRITTREVRFADGSVQTTAPALRQLVFKTADESVGLSTVLQDDDELLLAPPNLNARYLLEGLIRAQTPGPAGIKIDFTVPAGASGTYGISRYVSGGGGSFEDAATIGTDETLDIPGGDFIIAQFIGQLLMGATPGALQFVWAQGAASIAATTVLAGSWLALTRLPGT